MSELAKREPSEVVLGWRDPLDPWIDQWLKVFKSQNTKDSYRRDIERWRNHVHNLGGDMLGARHAAFLDWCGELVNLRKPNGQPFAQTTRARWESTVTSFYDFCVEVEAVPVSPAHQKGAKHRTRPGEPEKPTPALTGPQITAWLEAGAYTEQSEMFTSILYETGCRVSELINAKVKDVSFRDGTVRIKVTRKGGKFDELTLAPSLGASVLEYIEDRSPTDPLVPAHPIAKRKVKARADGHMDRKEADWIVERAGVKAGIPFTVTPHVIRTTGINLLIESGKSLHVAQQFAGHSRVSTTEIYLRRANKDAEAIETAATLNKFMPRKDRLL